MERLSRYGRRMRITLIKTMTVACFVCIIAIPFLSKKLLKTEANYYSITINGIKVGAANTEEEVIVALASARQELSAQYEEIVYMDPDYLIAYSKSTVCCCQTIVTQGIFKSFQSQICHISSKWKK